MATATTLVSPAGTGPKSTDSLSPVLRAIPARCHERSTAKGLAYVARALVVYLGALALLALTDTWWLVLPLWILAGFAVAGLFVLGHDAAHGALFDSKRLNRNLGRVLMLPSLHVFEAWVLGHNRIHHGHTLRQGMDFVWHPVTVDEYRALPRWKRLRHRVEWSWLGSGLYYGREVWWNKMMMFTPPERYRKSIRRDARFVSVFAGLAVLGAGTVGWFVGGPLGSAWLVVKLFVVPFLLFIWLIGFTVYVHHVAPDVRWWPRRTWTSFAGQVEGTTVLSVPRVWNLFFHNIFVHVPHHVDVRIPFYALPEAAAAIKAEFPDAVHYDKLRLRGYLASTRACKLYDFDEQRWLTYTAVSTPHGR
jgi:omega-6 fatty acid desaturase (delta-12 desaturase)